MDGWQKNLKNSKNKFKEEGTGIDFTRYKLTNVWLQINIQYYYWAR